MLSPDARPSRHPFFLFALIACLYTAQGVPMGLAVEALPNLLRRDGAPLASLSFLPLIGIPWIAKVLWAPWLDNHWSRRLGRRRSWILPMQAIIALSLLALAMLGIKVATTPVAVGLLILAALASATQDTATDGLAAEHIPAHLLPYANGVQVACTMVGFFIGGAGMLIVSGLAGARAGLLTMTALVLAGLLLALVWHEPARQVARDAAATRPPASLRRFLWRPGAGLVLTIALVTAVAASAGFNLSKLLLVDRGWPLEKIGQLGMSGGIVTVTLGCGGGALLVARFGVYRVLAGGLICAAASILLLWLFAAMDGVIWASRLVWLATLLGALGSGAASVAAMTLAMRFAAGDNQGGTDMTAVQSTRDLGEIATASAAMALAGAVGYGTALAAAAVVPLLGIVLLFRRPLPTHAE